MTKLLKEFNKKDYFLEKTGESDETDFNIRHLWFAPLRSYSAVAAGKGYGRLPGGGAVYRWV